MHQIQRQKTHELLQSHGLRRALFAHHESVIWLTGFTPRIQLGPHQFSGGPSLVWYEDGHFTLIVQDAFADIAQPFSEDDDSTLIAYDAYSYEAPIRPYEALASALAQCVRQSRTASPVGIEARSVTAYQQQTLIDTLSTETMLSPIDQWLLPLRRIKTAEELVKLRANFTLSDLGHRTAYETIQPGMREIDLWMAIHTAINRQAGRPVPLGNDLVVGYRQPQNIGGPPADYVFDEHTSVIIDISTVLDGYWSDSCGTYFAGGPTARQREIYEVVRATLDDAIVQVRPGLRARDLDQHVRDSIRRAGFTPHPHHTGHSVGVSLHEGPRIVPYNDDTLEAGMVIMLEPGIYFPGETGVRLEDAMLITPDGAEVLTTHGQFAP